MWLAFRSETWLDEANSVLIALAPLRDLATTLGPDSSPPLYYLILKVWAYLVPFDPFWLRVPSLVFGCATIPAIWMVGRTMDRSRTGVIAAWLLALSPLHAYYSEEIRMYAMLALLGLAFYFALFHLLKTTGRILPALLFGVALAYTHYYGLVFAGAGILVALVVLRDRRRSVLLCGVGIVGAFIPWLPVFVTQLRNPHHVNWIGEFWAGYPGGFGMMRTVQAFMPGGMKYPFVPLHGAAWQLPVAALFLFPFVLLAARDDRRESFTRLVLPAVVIVSTLLILVIRSYTASPIYLAGRSDVVALPIFLLMLAMAVSRTGRGARLLFLAGWTVLSGVEVLGSAESLEKSGNVAIAEAVDAARCRVVVATGLTYAPVLFYQMVADDGARVVPFPIDMGDHPGNLNAAAYTSEQLVGDARILAREFPPGEGLCVLGASSSFSGPLAQEYGALGGTPEEVGVYRPSLMAGAPYVLVRVSAPDGS